MRFALLILPWLELFTLIELGIRTSFLTVLLYVFITVLVGLAILQRQGRGILERLREARDGRNMILELLLDDMALGLAGLLLIIPGMITDLVALILAIGPLRRRLVRLLPAARAVSNTSKRASSGPQTIEGEFRRIKDDKDT